MGRRVTWAVVVVLLLAAGIWALGIAPHANYIASVRGYSRCVADEEEKLRAHPRMAKQIKGATRIQMHAEGRCQAIHREWETMFDPFADTPLGTPNRDLPPRAR